VKAQVYHYRPKEKDRAICGYRGTDQKAVWSGYFVGLAIKGIPTHWYDGSKAQVDLCEDCLEHPDVVLEILANV